MFDLNPSNPQNIDDVLLNCVFNTLQMDLISKLDKLINQKLLNQICIELDDKYFNNMNLLFEDNIGIQYADLQEIVKHIYEYLKKSGTNFKHRFSEFERFNINLLIKKDDNEAFLIIVSIFNCANKDILISRFIHLDENIQAENIKILEKYMVVDSTPRDSMNSIRYSIRDTVVEVPLSHRMSENDIFLKYLSRIENLERDKDNVEKEYKNLTEIIGNKDIEVEKLKKEKNSLQASLFKLEEIHKNVVLEMEELIKGQKIIQMEDLLKETQKVKELRSILVQKETEIKYLTEERANVEETYIQEICNLKENLEILKENINILSEHKLNYEKLKDSIRDYEILKDRLIDYENTQRELSILQKINNEMLITSSEQKEMIKKLQSQINNINIKNDERNIMTANESDQDKKTIIEQEEKINGLIEKSKKLEEVNIRLTQKNEELIVQVILAEESLKKSDEKIKFDGKDEENRASVKDESDENNSNIVLSERFILESENENYKNTLKIKEDTIQIQEEHINSLEEEKNGFKLEIELIKKELSNELNRKNEDIEFIKKESLELKEKYEREFELVSSSLYNLGLCYWSMKVEYTQKLSEKPTWLMKERQKYYNGDY